MNTLQQATEKVTIELMNSMEYGEEKQLNETFTLYKYSEEDVYTIVLTESWDEVFQVLTDGERIILEVLDSDIVEQYED
jgi:hypothetical protein